MKAVMWPVRALWRGVRRVARWVVGRQRPATGRDWALVGGRAAFVLLMVVVSRLLLDELSWTFREQIYAGGQALSWLINTAVLVVVIIGVIALCGAVLLDGSSGGGSNKPVKPVPGPDKPPLPSLGSRFGSPDANLTVPSAALPRAAQEARRAPQAAQGTASKTGGAR